MCRQRPLSRPSLCVILDVQASSWITASETANACSFQWCRNFWQEAHADMQVWSILFRCHARCESKSKKPSTFASNCSIVFIETCIVHQDAIRHLICQSHRRLTVTTNLNMAKRLEGMQTKIMLPVPSFTFPFDNLCRFHVTFWQPVPFSRCILTTCAIFQVW